MYLSLKVAESKFGGCDLVSSAADRKNFVNPRG